MSSAGTPPERKTRHPSEQVRIAEAVRDACLAAARDGFETAGMSGLCREGAIEMSLDSIRRMDLTAIIASVAVRH